MSRPDLNLLTTLDVLLAEGSVARAARRLRLSPSAMSRALARLRHTMGDPLLVRAGRGLIPTPRAMAIREQVGRLAQDAAAVLRPAEKIQLKTLVRTFTIRCSEGFAETYGPGLIHRLRQEAPQVRLRFMQKADKESTLLREGLVDIETGVLEAMIAPEIRTLALFKDRYIGVVRPGHPLAKGKMTAIRYAAGQHIQVSREGHEKGQIDEALSRLKLERPIATIVGGFATALALARYTDMIATVPERHTAGLRASMHTFSLPFTIAGFTVSMLWHPRLEADPAHQWLRACMREVCAAA